MKSFLYRHQDTGAKGSSCESLSVSRVVRHAERPEPLDSVSFRSSGALSIGALAIGALSLGALAVGAVAIGRLFIGKLFIRSARIDRLDIGELNVSQSPSKGKPEGEGSRDD